MLSENENLISRSDDVSQPSALQTTNPVIPTTQRPRKTKVFALVVSLVVLLAAVGLGMFWFLRASNPESVFRASIKNALSTPSYTQEVNITDMDQQIMLKYDLKDTQNLRVFASVDVKGGLQDLRYDMYASKQNTYVRLKNQTNQMSADQQLNNKWVQIVKDGISLEDAQSSSAITTITPSSGIFGQYIMGSFNGDQSKKIEEAINTSEIYNYDKKAVVKETLDGEDAYVYQVSISPDKLRTLNEKVAVIIGLPKSDIGSLSIDNKALEAKLYVSIKKQRLVKVKTNQTTVTYSDWGTTELPSEPKADYRIDEYLKSKDTGSSTSSAADKNADLERKIDINALATTLEVYYNEFGYYPEFSQINDLKWREKNLRSIAETAFTEPLGSSNLLSDKLVTGQYTYQVSGAPGTTGCSNGDINKNICSHFVLSVKLSTGTVLTKQSLN